MSLVYLGLGSNIGDRLKNIYDAVDLLSAYGLSIERLSSVIETEPVGGPPQAKFLNAAVKAQTKFSPQQLLATIKTIEKQLGRQPTVVNGPRIIDIDILFYDDLCLNLPELTIPHPRIFQRDFVIIPLKEIMPSLCAHNAL